MINATTPQVALNQYRSAGESWRTLCADRENKQQQLEMLVRSEVNPLITASRRITCVNGRTC